MLFRKGKLSGWVKWATAIVAFFAAADIMLTLLLPVRVLNLLKPDDTFPHLALIAVLFHDFSADDTGVSSETKRRIHYALSLVERKGVRYILVAGGNRPDMSLSGADRMALYIRSIGGVDPAAIIVENKSRDSMSNLENIGRVMDGLEAVSAGLVSSPLHLWRIQEMDKVLQRKFFFLPYDAASCSPPLSRKEIWYMVHYNLAAYAAYRILPRHWYARTVRWIREHTDF